MSCRVMRVTAALHLQMGTFSLGVCAQCPGWAGPLLSCGLRVGRTPARPCMEGIGEWSGGPEEDGCWRVCHDGGQTEGRWDPVLGFSHLRKLGLARLWCGVERVGGRRGYKVIMKSCELLGWSCCLSWYDFLRVAHCLAHFELFDNFPETSLYFILRKKYHGHHQSSERRLLTPCLRHLSLLHSPSPHHYHYHHQPKQPRLSGPNPHPLSDRNLMSSGPLSVVVSPSPPFPHPQRY